MSDITHPEVHILHIQGGISTIQYITLISAISYTYIEWPTFALVYSISILSESDVNSQLVNTNAHASSTQTVVVWIA